MTCTPHERELHVVQQLDSLALRTLLFLGLLFSLYGGTSTVGDPRQNTGTPLKSCSQPSVSSHLTTSTYSAVLVTVTLPPKRKTHTSYGKGTAMNRKPHEQKPHHTVTHSPRCARSSQHTPHVHTTSRKASKNTHVMQQVEGVSSLLQAARTHTCHQQQQEKVSPSKHAESRISSRS